MTAGGTELIRRRRWASGTSRTDGRTDGKGEGVVKEWGRRGGVTALGSCTRASGIPHRLSDDTPTQNRVLRPQTPLLKSPVRLIAIMVGLYTFLETTA
jgi:hypothetical protein